MRVLFITGEFPPMQGGVGDCTFETARALVALGVAARVLTATKARGGLASAVGVQPIIAHWGWSSWRVIARAVRTYEPDIVHIEYQTGAYQMHPAIDFLPRYLRAHVVTTFHDLRVPYLFPKAGRVREWVTRELARSSDATIATNAEDYATLARYSKVSALIPIGSNITTAPPANYDRAAWRAQLGVAENESLLCYFGFLNESKGGETLIRALAQMPNAKLLFIGGQVGASDPTNQAYRHQVTALIVALGLTPRVIWTDYTPPEIVTANLLAADVCALPYRDGASYRRGTLMAALAHGCAIVTTVASHQGLAVSQQLPQLEHETNCVLIPPDDPRALAQAIQRVLASPELRAKIGAGAHALAQHFTWDRIAQQHLEFYQQITKRE